MSQATEVKASPPPSVSEPPVASDSIGDDINNHNSSSNALDPTDTPSPAVTPSRKDATANDAPETGTQTGKGKEQGSAQGPTAAATTNANANANPNAAEGKTNEGKNVASEYSPNVMYTFANTNANATATPLSPMHPHHMQNPYYYSQNVPNSPATPSYDSMLGAQNALPNNMFMRQQYPVIPPLSPHASNDCNNDDGNGNYAATMNHHNLSMGIVPPASPLFPGTMPIFGSEQMESGGRSMNMMNGMGVGIAPNSPSLQYLGGPPPSPVISYGGIYPSGIQGSPGHSSWSERCVCDFVFGTIMYIDVQRKGIQFVPSFLILFSHSPFSLGADPCNNNTCIHPQLPLHPLICSQCSTSNLNPHEPCPLTVTNFYHHQR